MANNPPEGLFAIQGKEGAWRGLFFRRENPGARAVAPAGSILVEPVSSGAGVSSKSSSPKIAGSGQRPYVGMKLRGQCIVGGAHLGGVGDRIDSGLQAFPALPSGALVPQHRAVAHDGYPAVAVLQAS